MGTPSKIPTTFEAFEAGLTKDYYAPEGLELMRRAHAFAEIAHVGQTRKTGEPYFVHAFATAQKLTDLQLPPEVVAAGFLHDVVEDTEFTHEDVLAEFGEDIAGMVRSVTKLGHVKYRGIERYVENLRKMFLAMAKDVRVVFIKFADRMHNMETLYMIPEEKRNRIASEVKEIYAPIANRLGMGEYRGLFEDYSFKYLEPKEYNWTKHLLEQRVKKFGPSMDNAMKEVEQELLRNNITPVSIHGRIKFCYSLYKKLKRHSNDINKVYDIVALRIVVSNVSECYAALGILHSMFKPLSGRIKDYIAQPKPNSYQSLHTTVFSDDGSILEFQIRTLAMHEEAEFGVASHWRYKEKSRQDKQVKWMEDLSQIQKELSNTDFMDRLNEMKLDMFQDRIFIFSPQGDVFDLPLGSTPIDFAYCVHTDVGNKAVGAKINTQQASLDSELKSGDMCEIVINQSKKNPSADWLKFAKTQYARAKIREAMKRDKRSLLRSLMNR